MTEQEKSCYNTFLASTRSIKNQPFKIRKNFKDFEKKENYIHVQRLCRIFNQFPNIDQSLYFKAPYLIYPDHQYFGLDFYSSQKAIRTYTLYLQQRQNKDIDSDEMLAFIRDSLKFIAKYCFTHNLNLDEYINFKEGMTYGWFQHLKNHNICVYVLFVFPGFRNKIYSLTPTEKELLNKVYTDIQKYQSRYHHSKISKKLINQGTKKIKKMLDEYLD